MKTEEENMGKEKELLSDEELLEVAAGRFPGNVSHDATPEELIRIEHCMQTCMKKWNDSDKCKMDCEHSNSL